MNEPWLTAFFFFFFWLWCPQSPAQYHLGPAPLCFPLTGATPLLNAPFDKTADGQGWVAVGLWSTSSLIPPTIKTLLKNKRLFGQSQSPGAWGSSAFLPRLSPPLFLPECFKASAFPCLLGQDIKQDPRGSDCQPAIPHKRKTYSYYSQIFGLP